MAISAGFFLRCHHVYIFLSLLVFPALRIAYNNLKGHTRIPQIQLRVTSARTMSEKRTNTHGTIKQAE